jgi:polyhydroxybutyrate depolymerase
MKSPSAVSFLTIALSTLFLLFTQTSHAQCESISVLISSNTGEWGDEMSWSIIGPIVNIDSEVASFQGTSDYTLTNDTLCLEPGCYAIIMLDSWGDGWNGGSISIELPDSTIYLSMDQNYLEYQTFEINSSPENCTWELPGCTNPTSENFIIGATIDDGSCFTTEMFYTSEDNERTYFLYTPENLAPNSPLMFVLHGYYGDAMGMSVFCGMNQIAEAEGFAVCYPQGLPDNFGINHWNANLTGTSDVNDVLFLTELAEYLQASHGFSEDCTYSCGYSNGGYMSYTLACESSDVFRGIGSVGGTMSGYDYANCAPTLVPVVHLHGTNDDDVSYYATSPNPNNPWVGAPGVEAVVQHWADSNNCESSSTTTLPDLDTNDGSTVDLIKHFDGYDGYQAWLYRVNEGEHDWFGAWGNMDINSSAVIWSFLSQFCGTTISIDELLIDTSTPNIFTLTGNSIHSSQDIEIKGLENCTIHIFDSNGRLLRIHSLFKDQTTHISPPCSGLYTIVAHTKSNGKASMQSERIVVN